jgi:hypothetical protein
MVSKILAAVFSEDDTTAKSCKPVRLVLTERSHARINLETRTCTMILLYYEESDLQSTLRVVISSLSQIWEVSTGTTSFWGTTHGCSSGFRCQWNKYCDLVYCGNDQVI